MGFITLNTLKKTVEDDPALLAERVFSVECEAGIRFIDYLKKVTLKKDLCLNAPTLEAWESEIRLVQVLDRADELDRDDLNGAVADYCNTHWLYRQTGRQWLEDVPLFFMRLLINGETHENTTCNEIQVHLIRAYWESLHPEAHVKWRRI